MADARLGVANKVEGRVTLHVSAGLRRVTAVYYVVNGVQYSVPIVAQAALAGGLIYRLYTTPQAKKIISIEPLGK